MGSYGQNADLEETMKSSQPKYYANASLSFTVLGRKNNILCTISLAIHYVLHLFVLIFV